jgi:hypothetical protein
MLIAYDFHRPRAVAPGVGHLVVDVQHEVGVAIANSITLKVIVRVCDDELLPECGAFARSGETVDPGL